MRDSNQSLKNILKNLQLHWWFSVFALSLFR